MAWWHCTFVPIEPPLVHEKLEARLEKPTEEVRSQIEEVKLQDSPAWLARRHLLLQSDF
jgi:hypothetical protein